MTVRDTAASGPRSGVVGWPVAHSRSPLIHGHWLARHGIAGSYGLIPVAPAEIAVFFAGFAATGLVGANVTVPHKEAALAACADVEPEAREIGAVNTLWMDGGRLRGTNTDAHGFLANLDQRAPGWDKSPGRALVLGAGGAARAIVWGLVRRGFDVAVVNRTVARAEDLVRAFGPAVSARGWDAVPRLLRDARLAVNTTSLGMDGHGEMDIDFSVAADDMLVTDAVYVPVVTPFLAAASARGLATVDGLGMLLHQAVPGFEKWFGLRPEVTDELRALVLADIERSHP